MTAEPSVTDRLGWLGRNSRIWILALLLLVVAVAVGASWTLGAFSSESANPRNVATAGSMRQVNSAEDAAFMGATDMVPGSVVEGSVTIGNEGDASGVFTLVVEDVVDEPGPQGGRLSTRLRLTVTDSKGGDVVYDGSLGALDVSLGTWAPGEERTYVFRVRLPDQSAGADNAYQGSKVTAAFVWQAVQSP